MLAQQRLIGRFTKNLPPGRLNWIGLRPARKQAMVTTQFTQAIANQGLEGDHRCEKTPGSARQVTLISEEYIRQIEHFTNLEKIDPALLRRNLVVSGINLHVIRHQRFSIGEAEFESTALCHPCSRMEEALGPGGFAAMYGHGGICAKIIRSGLISVGDKVEIIPPA